MIPLKDENPSQTMPFITLTLLTVNVVVFVYFSYVIPADRFKSLPQLTFIPYEWFHLTDIGTANRLSTPATLITSMFLHGGWLHLLSNMLYLWIFGDNVEDRLGHLRFLLFYLLCGTAGAIAHGAANMNSTVPTIGASGAIAGVLGAYLILFPGARIRTLFIIFIFIKVFRIPAFVILLYWISLQMLSAYAEYQANAGGGGIAWFAHIGGFFAGMILLLVMRKKKPSGPRTLS